MNALKIIEDLYSIIQEQDNKSINKVMFLEKMRTQIIEKLNINNKKQIDELIEYAKNNKIDNEIKIDNLKINISIMF